MTTSNRWTLALTDTPHTSPEARQDPNNPRWSQGTGEPTICLDGHAKLYLMRAGYTDRAEVEGLARQIVRALNLLDAHEAGGHTLAHDAVMGTPDHRCLCGVAVPSRTALYRHVDMANGHTQFPEDDDSRTA